LAGDSLEAVFDAGQTDSQRAKIADKNLPDRSVYAFCVASPDSKIPFMLTSDFRGCFVIYRRAEYCDMS